MKVVLFCGGLGTRLRGLGEDVPKPMVRIGYRPILWHVMKYYAHYGHKEFILCLGYRADAIKSYFLNYDECQSNDFTMTHGGKRLDLITTDIEDWKITFVDTGLKATIGQRLRAARPYLGDDETFLANYSDGLTDLPLPELLDFYTKSGKIGALVTPPPSQTFHVVALGPTGLVQGLKPVRDSGILINGGYFVFNKKIFDYMGAKDDLVGGPFERLIAEGQLVGYRHAGFWCMDTFKEQQELTDLVESGAAPWEVWRRRNGNGNGGGA